MVGGSGVVVGDAGLSDGICIELDGAVRGGEAQGLQVCVWVVQG